MRFDVFDETQTILPVARGWLYRGIKAEEVIIDVLDEDLTQVFAGHRSKRDGQEFAIRSDDEMNANFAIVRSHLVTASILVFVDDAQLRFAEH
jgi:hypothetical protein